MKTMKSIMRARGVSLIELMIALVIGSLLVLGLVEVFSASRTAYQLSEGLSRVQENGRFAMDYIQRDFRMAGHMGCVNDQARFLPESAVGTRSSLASTFLTSADQLAENYAGTGNYVPDALRFDMPIQGYEAANTAPGDMLPLATAPTLNNNAGDWTPQLPTALDAALDGRRIGGSDILVLRQFSPRGAQVTNFTPGDPSAVITVSAVANLQEGATAVPRLLGIADCMSAGVFQATSVVGNVITVTRNAGLNLSAMAGYEPYVPGQANVYVAETVVYFVGLNTDNNPSLYRLRYNMDAAGALTGTPEELVEGIDSLQLRYGIDSRPNPADRPSGNMGSSQEAATTTPWRRVGLVQVGLVARSNDRAGTQPRDLTVANKLSALGVEMNAPNDGRYRTVYESTIALRNRLFGN